MKPTFFSCHICGDEKESREFRNVCYFTSYKKKPVQWCRDCQKMYLAMKKEEEHKEEQRKRKINYLVTF